MHLNAIFADQFLLTIVAFVHSIVWRQFAFFYMFRAIGIIGKGFLAIGTFIWFVAGMSLYVCFELILKLGNLKVGINPKLNTNFHKSKFKRLPYERISSGTDRIDIPQNLRQN